MDPSIMKFLEEDEDETMHSGADVEAFTAALNRDIEAASQGSGNTSVQFQPTWEPTRDDENSNQNQQESVSAQPEKHPSEVRLKHPEFGSDNQQQVDNSSQGQAPPNQHEQPPPKDICQQTLQTTDSQCHEKTPMDIDESGVNGNKEGESEKLKKESAINQQVLTTGTSNQLQGAIGMGNQQAPAIETNSQQAISSVTKNQQVIATAVGNHQPTATTMSSQQLAGSGANSQQLARPTMHQQSPASGMINQPPMAMGINNHQSVAMGMNNQRSVAMGMNNQQSVAMAMNNKQPMAMGLNNKQPGDIGVNTQQPLAVGVKNQQTMTSGSNQPVINSGLGSQQAMSMGVANQQAINLLNRGKQVPFALLLPVIQPLLDRDRSTQLQTLYLTLKKNEITKEAFVRHMRGIVGDQMLKMAVYKLQQQAARDAAAQQHMQGPSNVQAPAESSDSTLDNNALQPYEVGRQGDSHNMQATTSSYFSASSQDREHQTYPVQGLTKQQQQHLHFSQASYPTVGSTGNNQRPFPTSNVTPAASLKQAHDSQMRQLPVHHNNAVQWHQSNDHQQRSHFSASQGLSSVPTLHAEHGNSKNDAFEMQSSKMGVSASTSQMDHNLPLNSRVPSAPSPIAAANSPKTLIKKPSVGQKKPLEALGSSPPPSSKKQKVSGGGLLDQSIEQLNDVTAVSGVNLREEEEQLFSGPKEDSRVSEASRRVVQEEEDRLILQKNPLQKKLAEIMAKGGLKSIGNDVEKCLSLCVEERMRGLMSCLIRLAKQRVDIEKNRHRTLVTTDVRKKIMAINQKVRVEWEKKQAEEVKLLRLNDPERSAALDGDKDESRARAVKLVANKEEDEKMRTTAANVAARAAVGGDDMFSKWKLMAEQAKQKQEGGTDGASGSQAGIDVPRKTSTAGKSAKDHHEAEKRGQLSSNPGSIRKVGRNQVIMAHNRVARAISVKDVIAVLEREPQMSRSTLIYRLYDKIRSESSAE
ncbi:hypothetical protein Leryth_017157 [Lithospermum erythrorhizon]|nr:hypothetical protein Leryth_017157 [Lithospermum erythrorhizon]